MAHTCVENLPLQFLSYIAHISLLNKIFFIYIRTGKIILRHSKKSVIAINILKNYHINIKNFIKLLNYMYVLYVDYFSNHYVKLPLKP